MRRRPVFCHTRKRQQHFEKCIGEPCRCSREPVGTQKTKAMLRKTTVILMANPSLGLAFYFRPSDDEHCDRVFNRCRDSRTWTHVSLALWSPTNPGFYAQREEINFKNLLNSSFVDNISWSEELAVVSAQYRSR